MPSEHPRRPTLSPCRGDESDDYENVGYHMQVRYTTAKFLLTKNMRNIGRVGEHI